MSSKHHDTEFDFREDRVPLAATEPSMKRISAQPECYRIDVHLNGTSPADIVREDIRRGLTAYPKSLPPKYFYDARGSALFDRITQLPEYYLTRVEKRLIASLSDELMERVRPQEVVELGSGSANKIRMLLDAQSAASHLIRYTPFDVDERAVQASVEALTRSYPLLDAYGVVGDFENHLRNLPPPVGRRLVVFFGSTIGNLDPQTCHELLVHIRGLMSTGDRLLLGIDLVKDPVIMEAAYNDSCRVTAEFNRNMLRVVNRAVRADFRPDAFEHYAYYNRQASRIEMHLAPASLQRVNLRDLDLSISIRPDETIWTENSYKFTRESATGMLVEAGLGVERWYTDDDRAFALVLADLQ